MYSLNIINNTWKQTSKNVGKQEINKEDVNQSIMRTIVSHMISLLSHKFTCLLSAHLITTQPLVLLNPSACLPPLGGTRTVNRAENTSVISTANRSWRHGPFFFFFFENRCILHTKCSLSLRSEGLMKPVIIISMLH